MLTRAVIPTGKDCFGELFQISLPSCVLSWRPPHPDRHRRTDRLVEPAIVRARNVIAWTRFGGSLRCLIDSGSEVDLVDRRWLSRPELRNGSLTAPLHLRLGTRISPTVVYLCHRSFSVWRLDLVHERSSSSGTGYDVRKHSLHCIKLEGSLPSLRPESTSATGFRVSSAVASRSTSAAQPTRLPTASSRTTVLDVVDGPALEDLSEFAPNGPTPPYRPSNHEIPLIDPNKKVKPKVYPLARQISCQPPALSSTCSCSQQQTPQSIFRHPRHDQVFGTRCARSRYRSKFDVAARCRAVRVIPEYFDQLYYVSDVVIAKSDECISTYLFDQLYYVSDVVIAKSDE
ncbi:BZ3500_MvSof-1268-A1-R1_C130g00705 [Microbotryum saponariae]|uniref:BZ3500_MvSof-1268-A1-R1_C130g00705 protein n=1 Tax=Microbotryum saponariae TaxID=289078 RepID=A0A2X0M3L2_9BASI|nr:BZ3500_MvSof-1268-A1-R1_C130g00705 [Microbotryum saponariae]